MNTISQYDTQSSRPSESSTALISISLGLLFMMYLLFDHFEKSIQTLLRANTETMERFHVTEDKLATLEELEEDVRLLKEKEEEKAEKEREKKVKEEKKKEEKEEKNTSTWEDDVTEPGKYQALVGRGTLEGVEYEFRYIREKLLSFKSNRYWILSDIPYEFITREINMRYRNRFNNNISDILYSYREANDIDHDMLIDCKVIKNTSSKTKVDFTTVVEEASKRDSKFFKWKRALINTSESM